MLWHVRIPLRQKLILIGIFSVTVVVMITAIIRVGIVNSIDENAEISWLYLWSNIEMATCMCPHHPVPLYFIFLLSICES